MNLGELRDQFVELSGRYDLVNEDGTDNGADFFISRGQAYLDRRFEAGAGTQLKDITLSAGDWTKTTSNLRRAEELWVQNDDGVWVPLRRVSFNQLAWWFPKLNQTEKGFPTTFTSRTPYGAKEPKLYILPPPEVSRDAKLSGVFKAAALSSATDTNFWSDLYPDILIMAAQREIEVFHRNSQGIQDWEQVIQLEMKAIEEDYVASQTYHINQMEG